MFRPRRLRPLLGLVCLGVLAGLIASPAQATFPGGNGRIAYTWSLGGEGFEEGRSPGLVGVVSVRPDGGGRQLVARRGTRPRYSPDGRRIAFLRSHHPWVARADGRSARQVSPSDWLVGSYDWSPRGTRLAFVRDFVNGGAAIYTVRPDGSGLQRLVKASQGISLASGAWSPDGKAIVYEQHSLRTLVRVSRAGRITTLARVSHRPTWSRRGLIAYEHPPLRAVQPGLRQAARGASPASLLRLCGRSSVGPTWSPDGRRLMFMYTPQLQGPAEIWTVRPDGTVLDPGAQRQQLPDLLAGRALARLQRDSHSKRARVSRPDVMRPDGSGKRRLVRGGQASGADWRPLR